MWSRPSLHCWGFLRRLRQVERPSLRLKTRCDNIRATGEFVVNVVTFAVAEAMNLTSGEYDSSVDEFEIAKLTTRPSQTGEAAAGGGIAGQLRVQAGKDYRFRTARSALQDLARR